MESLPYVYRLTHKVTGQFYIGYRYGNAERAELDLPKYQSSSKVVKSMGFESFDWEIVAELPNSDDAYDLENRLIEENIRNPLCINGRFQKNGSVRFKMPPNHSEETRAKIARSHTNLIISDSAKSKIAAKMIGNQNKVGKKIDSSDWGRRFRVKSPDGVVYEGKNLRAFCVEHSLDDQYMSRTCRGLQRQHKGWTGSYL